jgi:AcrR family transcriptional regulator
MGRDAQQRGPVDRRRARSGHTREVLVEAAIGHVAESGRSPTLAEVALRAGVSTRTVHNHFHGVDALLVAALAERLARSGSAVAALPARGPVGVRIDLLCHQRRLLHEELGPFLHLADARASSVDGLAALLAAERRLRRRQVAAAFAPELGAGTHPVVLDQLDLATGWPYWSALRALGYRPGRAEAVVAETVRRTLLAGSGAARPAGALRSAAPTGSR